MYVCMGVLVDLVELPGFFKTFHAIGRQIKRRIWKTSQASKKRQAFRGLSQRSRRYAKQVGLRKRILTRALRVVRQEATAKR